MRDEARFFVVPDSNCAGCAGRIAGDWRLHLDVEYFDEDASSVGVSAMKGF